MKRIICILFVFILIFTLSSCKKEREYREDNYTVSESFEMKTEKDTYPEDIDIINYTLSNISDSDNAYGLDIELSKLVNGEWKIVEFDKEIVVYEIAYTLSANTDITNEFIISDYFDYPLDPGEYRLVKPGIARSNTFIIE